MPTVNTVHQPTAMDTNKQQMLALYRKLCQELKDMGIDPDAIDSEQGDLSKPFPSEHAARIADPKSFDSIRRQNDKFGPGISVIWGVKNGMVLVQSIRFAADKFTPEQAKTWLKNHRYIPIEFASATTKSGILRDSDPLQEALISNSSDSPPVSVASSSKALDQTTNVLKDTISDSTDEEATTPIEKSWTVEITKADSEKQVVYGVAYPLYPLGGKDSQNDRASADEIEKMAWNFMKNSRMYDLQHKEVISNDKAVVVESYIAPIDFTMGNKTISKGSWVVATHVLDMELWNLVKSGQVGSYSIRGFGKRTPIK